MKTLKQLIAVAALVAAPFMTSGVAAADTYTCDVGYTGPDSNNNCVIEETYTCTVENENIITVDNGNTQISLTGDSDSEDNNDGGSSLSGSAENENGTVFDIVVRNDGDNGDVCTLTTTVPATPTPEAPTETVTPTEKSEPVVLADTASSNSIYALIVLSVVALGAAAGTVAVARIAKR